MALSWSSKSEMRGTLLIGSTVVLIALASCLPTSDERQAPAPLHDRGSMGTEVASQRAARITLYARGEHSPRMPTGVAQLGTRSQPLCIQDFEWTLADGSRVRGVSDPSAEDAIPACMPKATALRVPAGTPISVAAEGTTYLRATRTAAPLYPGPEAIAIEVRWPEGQATFLAFLDVIVTDSSPTNIGLSCAPEDRISFQAPRGPRVLPGGSAYIRGNLEGIRRADIIEQMTLASPRTTSWDGRWQVVRDGAVIAGVRYRELDGVACRGSRVGGV